MSFDREKDVCRVLYAYLSENKVYLAYCDMKSTGKGYRHLLRNAEINPNWYERHLHQLYKRYGDPRKVDFETFWAKPSNDGSKIKDFSHGIRKKVRGQLKKLWESGRSPSMEEVLDFIEENVVNRQLEGMIGSRNRLLVSVNIENSQVKNLALEFEEFLKGTKLIKAPTQRRLEDLHFHLLLTSKSINVARQTFFEVYGKSHRTSDDTFLHNHKRYLVEVAKVQFHLLSGEFPGPKKLSKDQGEDFASFSKAELL